MKPKRAEFIKSATDPKGFPPQDLPEIAFAGRSNVGKSAVINMLVGKTGLAKTSNTPGRTRLLNWFRIEPQQAFFCSSFMVLITKSRASLSLNGV